HRLFVGQKLLAETKFLQQRLVKSNHQAAPLSVFALLLPLFLTDARLGAVEQPLDVAPVSPDHNDRKEQGEQKVEQHRPAQAQVDNQGDKRVENCAGNRHQRDNAGDKQHRQKDNQQNREDQGVHNKDDAQ